DEEADEEEETSDEEEEETSNLATVLENTSASDVYEAMPEEKQQELANVVPLKAFVKNRSERDIAETLCDEMKVEDLMKLASCLVQFVMGGKDTPRERLKAYANEIKQICDAVIPPEEEPAPLRKAG